MAQIYIYQRVALCALITHYECRELAISCKYGKSAGNAMQHINFRVFNVGLAIPYHYLHAGAKTYKHVDAPSKQ